MPEYVPTLEGVLASAMLMPMPVLMSYKKS